MKTWEPFSPCARGSPVSVFHPRLRLKDAGRAFSVFLVPCASTLGPICARATGPSPRARACTRGLVRLCSVWRRVEPSKSVGKTAPWGRRPAVSDRLPALPSPHRTCRARNILPGSQWRGGTPRTIRFLICSARLHARTCTRERHQHPQSAPPGRGGDCGFCRTLRAGARAEFRTRYARARVHVCGRGISGRPMRGRAREGQSGVSISL